MNGKDYPVWRALPCPSLRWRSDFDCGGPEKLKRTSRNSPASRVASSTRGAVVTEAKRKGCGYPLCCFALVVAKHGLMGWHGEACKSCDGLRRSRHCSYYEPLINIQDAGVTTGWQSQIPSTLVDGDMPNMPLAETVQNTLPRFQQFHNDKRAIFPVELSNVNSPSLSMVQGTTCLGSLFAGPCTGSIGLSTIFTQPIVLVRVIDLCRAFRETAFEGCDILCPFPHYGLHCSKVFEAGLRGRWTTRERYATGYVGEHDEDYLV